MQKYGQDGSTSVILSVLMTILFIAAASFAGWAYMGRQDYKNNSDQKTSTAVAAAEKAQEEKLRKEFEQDYKKPNKTYVSPSVMGSITFKYPKTWSAQVDTNGSYEAIEGYFHPDVVPALDGDNAFALRIELLRTEYANVLRNIQQDIESGKTKAKAYVPVKMKKVSDVKPGTYLTGVVSKSSSKERQGAMLIIQVRDKTLKIYTESPDFVDDFTKIVIPSLTFNP